MTVGELKKLLNNFSDDLEVFTSVWTKEGEKSYRTRLSIQDPKRIVKKDRYLRISWVDDCPADIIPEAELYD